MLGEENATVLLFRDARLGRPIDVVACMNADAPLAAESGDAPDNVIPLARFARTSRRGTWFGGPPKGEAA